MTSMCKRRNNARLARVTRLWIVVFLSSWITIAFSQENLADLDQQLSADPNNLELLTARAEILLNLGRLDEAITTMDTVVREHPASSEALLFRGSLKNLMGDRTGAEADVAAGSALEKENPRQKALKRFGEPSDASGYFARGEYRMVMLEDYLGAIEDFDRYFELVGTPKNTLAHMYKAKAQEALGALEDSLETIEEGLNLAGGEWARGSSIKARILEKLGKADESKRAQFKLLTSRLANIERYIRNAEEALENTNAPQAYQKELANLQRKRSKILDEIAELGPVEEETHVETSSQRPDETNSNRPPDDRSGRAKGQRTWLITVFLALCAVIGTGGFLALRRGKRSR